MAGWSNLYNVLRPRNYICCGFPVSLFAFFNASPSLDKTLIQLANTFQIIMSSQDLPLSSSHKHHQKEMDDYSIEGMSTAQQVATRSDEIRLQEMGHEQQLARRFSMPALLALCLSLMATWEALSSYIAPVLVSGGAPCLFYN